MAANRERDKVIEWRQRFDRYQGSVTTVEDFCRRERVSVAMFYYWRRELGSRSKVRAVAAAQQQAFAPVRLVSASNIIAHLPGGTRLEIPMADSQALERVIRSLVSVDAQRGEEA